MASESTAIRPALTRNQAGTLFGQTMGLVAVTAGLFAVGAYVGRNVTYQWSWLFFIGSLLLLVGVSAASKRSTDAAITLLFGFGVVTGLAVAYYASTNSGTVWEAGATTALFVAGFGAAGYATRRDLSALARALYCALLGLIVFGIVAVFVQIPNGSLVYTIVGLVIFAGLTAYTTSSVCDGPRTSEQRRCLPPPSSSTSSTCFSCCCRPLAAPVSDVMPYSMFEARSAK